MRLYPDDVFVQIAFRAHPAGHGPRSAHRLRSFSTRSSQSRSSAGDRAALADGTVRTAAAPHTTGRCETRRARRSRRSEAIYFPPARCSARRSDRRQRTHRTAFGSPSLPIHPIKAWRKARTASISFLRHFSPFAPSSRTLLPSPAHSPPPVYHTAPLRRAEPGGLCRPPPVVPLLPAPYRPPGAARPAPPGPGLPRRGLKLFKVPSGSSEPTFAPRLPFGSQLPERGGSRCLTERGAAKLAPRSPQTPRRRPPHPPAPVATAPPRRTWRTKRTNPHSQ